MRFNAKGDWGDTFKFLRKNKKLSMKEILDKYGKLGVKALSQATPKKTGLTSESWTYEIHGNRDNLKIEWINKNSNNGVPIAVILQYGHGTGTGGYVQGRDYINPAIQPVFDQMAEEIWREVIN